MLILCCLLVTLFFIWKGWLKLTPVSPGQPAFQLTLFGYGINLFPPKPPTS